MSTQPLAAPRGSMILRTLAMPADTNANGDIFGGWIMISTRFSWRYFSQRAFQQSRRDCFCFYYHLQTAGKSG